MGKRTRSVEENRKFQAARVEKSIVSLAKKFLGVKAKRLQRWVNNHPDKKAPRHIGEV